MQPLRLLLVLVVAIWAAVLLAWMPPTPGTFELCPTPDVQATAIWAAVDPTRTEIARRADALRARPNRPSC